MTVEVFKSRNLQLQCLLDLQGFVPVQKDYSHMNVRTAREEANN